MRVRAECRFVCKRKRVVTRNAGMSGWVFAWCMIEPAGQNQLKLEVHMESPSLAIIGGTGKEGNALAFRFAKAGVNVIIGSRDATKGDNAAREMKARLGATNVTGT